MQPIQLLGGSMRIFEVRPSDVKLGRYDIYYVDNFEGGMKVCNGVLPALNVVQAYEIARAIYNQGIEVWWLDVPYDLNRWVPYMHVSVPKKTWTEFQMVSIDTAKTDGDKSRITMYESLAFEDYKDDYVHFKIPFEQITVMIEELEHWGNPAGGWVEDVMWRCRSFNNLARKLRAEIDRRGIISEAQKMVGD